MTVGTELTLNGREVQIQDLVMAAWTGRDRAVVEVYIQQLAALGIEGPPRTPMYYRVSASLLSNADRFQVPGKTSTCEVEPVLFRIDGEYWVGVGSDHTDSEVEGYNVTVAKQMCPKPVANSIWRLSDVAGHWDSLRLRSYAVASGERVLYQEGSVDAIRRPEELASNYADAHPPLAPHWALFCGTLETIGAVRPAERFEIELEDPVLGRTISHAYSIESLPR